MKSLTRSLLLALALTTSSWVQAQSFEQALAASERGDYRTAFAGFKKLAEQGDAIAQFNLGLMYANGRGVPTDDRQAVAWYRKAAEKGIAKAQFNLGVMYDEGRGLPKDEQLALSWYRKAAEKGYADAQTMLGLMYANGLHVPKDEQQAVVWYRNAAEQGDAIAQFNLGLMHEDGDGVPKDEQQAVAWYRKAAEQGHAEAQFNLGLMYAKGKGVPQNDQQVVAWYRRAAEQGHASAQYNLGVRFYDGRGVPKDDQQAVAWFRKAADQGVAMAQTNLGKMYAKGSGVPKDEQMTYFWLLLASAQGDQDALKGRDIFERRLTTEQRAAAQAASRNWQPKATTQSSNGPIGSAAEAGTSASSANRPAPAAAQADATGSGFRVARGAIVTNHHVVDGCSRLRVNGAAAQVRSSDARSDLALLTVTLPGPSASLRAQRPAVGEPVAVAGFPLRGLLSGFNMTTGNLSSLSGMGGDTSYLQITAPVQPGNSGGPMLDSAGNLMGVVVSKLDAIKLAKITGDIPQNVNFAVHANVLRTFLDANSVDYDSASSEKPLATTAIAEKARGFTVLVECWK
jgi:TPR repeat protein